MDQRFLQGPGAHRRQPLHRCGTRHSRWPPQALPDWGVGV